MEKQRRPLDGPPPLPNAKGDKEVSRPPFTEDMKAARRAKADAIKRKAEAKPGPPPLDPTEREIARLEPLPGIKAKPEAKKDSQVVPPPLKPGARVRAGMPPNVEPVELTEVADVDASVPNIEDIDGNYGRKSDEVSMGNIVMGQKEEPIQAEQPVAGERSLEDAIDRELQAEEARKTIEGFIDEELAKEEPRVVMGKPETPPPASEGEEMQIARGSDQFSKDFASTTGVTADQFQKSETMKQLRESDESSYPKPDMSKRTDLQPKQKTGIRGFFKKIFGRG